MHDQPEQTDSTDESMQAGGGDAVGSAGGRTGLLVGGLIGVIVLLAVALVVVITGGDNAGSGDTGAASGGNTDAQEGFADLPPLEEVPMMGCQTAAAGPPGVHLVDAGVAATADRVLFVAETAAEPIYSGDYAGLQADDWSIFFDFTLWQQTEPGNFRETYLFLHPPMMSPGGLVGGGFIDPSHVEWGRDGRYSWMVVNRDGLSVIDDDAAVGVTISGTSQVYVDNNVLGSPDFEIGQNAEPAQWCPNEQNVHVVELPRR